MNDFSRQKYDFDKLTLDNSTAFELGDAGAVGTGRGAGISERGLGVAPDEGVRSAAPTLTATLGISVHLRNVCPL